MNYIRLISIFIACLVIMMPVTSADALAGINSVKASGDTGVDNVRRAYDDTLTIEVSAELADKASITKDNLYIAPVGASLEEFRKFTNDCTELGFGTYNCRFVDSDDFDAGFHEYDVMLFATTTPNEYTSSVSRVRKSLFVDEVAPELTILESPTQDGENVTIHYRVTDAGCEENNCPNKCSGIWKIEVPEAGEQFEINTTACSYEGTLSVYLSGTSERAIKLLAYDMAGNRQETTSLNFLNDHTQPIIQDTFTITRAGLPIESLSTIAPNRGMSQVEVSINIEEHNLSYVRADLSELNPNAASQYNRLEIKDSDIDSKCTKSGTTYTCKFTDLNVMLLKEDPMIEIGARDMSGNSAVKNISRRFVVDNEAPEVTFIGTEACVADKCYIGKGYNTLIVRMTESGSGFQIPYSIFGKTGVGRKVIMNLNSIMGAGHDRVFANECNLTAPEEWTCRWNNVQLQTSYQTREDFDVFILPESRDDAMNQLTGKLEAKLILNRNPPAISNFQIYSIRETEGINGTLVGGRHVSAGASVNSKVPVKAYGDFSSVVPGATNVEALCAFDEDAGQTICLWEDVGIAKSVTEQVPLINQEIVIRFVDYSGNVLIHRPRVDLLFEKNAPANYWFVDSSLLKIYPNTLDKQVMNLISNRIMANAPLSKTGISTVVPLKVSLDECTGADASLIGAKSISINPQDNEAWINLFLKTTTPSKGALQFDCTLRIVSKVNNRFVSAPELENVTITVPITDQSVGMASSINAKIADAKSDALFKLSDSGVFKTLNSIMDIAEKFCKIVGLVAAVNTLISSVMQVLDALRYTVGGKKVADAGQKAANVGRLTTSKLYQKMNKFCSYLSCFDSSGKPTGALAGDWYADMLKNRPQNPNKIKPGESKTGKSQQQKSGFLEGLTASPPTDVKNSFVLSVATLCLPGILYNLKKYRKIQCSYISCLKNAVANPQDPMPIVSCDKAKGFATCKFWWGEAFHVISLFLPQLNLFKRIGSIIDNILTHPIEFVIGKVMKCEATKASATKGQPTNKLFYLLCTLSETVPELESAKNQLKEAFSKGAWEIDESVCDEI